MARRAVLIGSPSSWVRLSVQPPRLAAVVDWTNASATAPAPTATRAGVLRPDQLAAHVRLDRADCAPEVAPWVENHWSLQWDLPDGCDVPQLHAAASRLQPQRRARRRPGRGRRRPGRGDRRADPSLRRDHPRPGLGARGEVPAGRPRRADRGARPRAAQPHRARVRGAPRAHGGGAADARPRRTRRRLPRDGRRRAGRARRSRRRRLRRPARRGRDDAGRPVDGAGGAGRGRAAASGPAACSGCSRATSASAPSGCWPATGCTTW